MLIIQICNYSNHSLVSTSEITGSIINESKSFKVYGIFLQLPSHPVLNLCDREDYHQTSIKLTVHILHVPALCSNLIQIQIMLVHNEVILCAHLLFVQIQAQLILHKRMRGIFRCFSSSKQI